MNSTFLYFVGLAMIAGAIGGSEQDHFIGAFIFGVGTVVAGIAGGALKYLDRK